MADYSQTLYDPAPWRRNRLDPRSRFASELLGSPTLELDSALLCVASAAGEVDVESVLETLDGAAIGLFDVAGAGCEVQSERLARILTDTLGLIAEDDDPQGLLVDRALAAREAHPLVIAAIGSELARRAGLCSYVCASPQGWWTVLVRNGYFALVGANAVERPAPGALRHCCPHQVARRILEDLATRAAEPTRSHARALALALPD